MINNHSVPRYLYVQSPQIMFETLQVNRQDKIGYLSLNRPDRMNALSRQLLSEIPKAVSWFNEQLDIQVVIVRGSGKAFSVGADLHDAMTEPGKDSSWIERREEGQLGAKMVEAIESLRAISIAEVHTYAIGGALLLMMACDFRIVAEGTIFSIPEVDLGIPLSWGGIPRLVREIGPLKTKELVMTCRRFGPEEAKSLNVINEIVPPDRLSERCQELAEQLAAKPSVPLLLTKEHVNSVAHTMGANGSLYSDGDVLLSNLYDPASRAAAMEYMKKQLGKKG